MDSERVRDALLQSTLKTVAFSFGDALPVIIQHESIFYKVTGVVFSGGKQRIAARELTAMEASHLRAILDH